MADPWAQFKDAPQAGQSDPWAHFQDAPEGPHAAAQGMSSLAARMQHPGASAALADARHREQSAPEFVRSINRGFLPFGIADQIDAGGAAAETALNNSLAHIGLAPGAPYSPQQAYDAVRQAQTEGQQEWDESHPVSSTASEVLGGVASGKALGSLIAKIPEGGSIVSRVLQSAGKALREKPVAQFVGGMAGAGAGKVARDLGAPAPVQIGASLAAAGLGAGAFEGLRSAGGAALRTVTQQGAKETASTLLRDAATAPEAAVENIKAAPAAASGAKPTLAEVAGDPGLAGFQRAEVASNATTGARVGQQMQENTAKRLITLDDTAGKGNPQHVQDMAQTNESALRAAVPAASEKLGPAAYAEDSGSATRTALQAAHEAAKVRTREAYNVPELLEAVPVDIPGENFRKITDAAKQFYGDADVEVPAELRNIIQTAAVEGNNTRALANIDRRLADYAGAARVAGRGREAAFAETIRQQIGASAEAGMPEAQRKAMAAARAARRDQADIFENGTVGRALDADRYGRPTMNASTVPQTIIPKGRAGAEAIEQLVRATGAEHAEAVVREELRRVADGASKPVDFERIASDFAPVLARFPRVAQDLQGARSAAILAEAFPKTALGRFAAATKDPGQIVETILHAKDGDRAFASLVKSVKSNPDAADGLRRALADYVTKAAKTSAVDSAGNQVASNGKALAGLTRIIEADQSVGLFSPQQLMALRQLQTEMKGTQFAQTANRAPGSDTARNLTQRFAKAGDAAAGGLKSVRLLKSVLGLMSNEKEVNALIERAIVEPDFAAELIKAVPPNRAERAAQNIRAAVIGGGKINFGADTAPNPNSEQEPLQMVIDTPATRTKGGKLQRLNERTGHYEDAQ